MSESAPRISDEAKADAVQRGCEALDALLAPEPSNTRRAQAVVTAILPLLCGDPTHVCKGHEGTYDPEVCWPCELERSEEKAEQELERVRANRDKLHSRVEEVEAGLRSLGAAYGEKLDQVREEVGKELRAALSIGSEAMPRINFCKRLNSILDSSSSVSVGDERLRQRLEHRLKVEREAQANYPQGSLGRERASYRAEAMEQFLASLDDDSIDVYLPDCTNSGDVEERGEEEAPQDIVTPLARGLYEKVRDELGGLALPWEDEEIRLHFESRALELLATQQSSTTSNSQEQSVFWCNRCRTSSTKPCDCALQDTLHGLDLSGDGERLEEKLEAELVELLHEAPALNKFVHADRMKARVRRIIDLFLASRLSSEDSSGVEMGPAIRVLGDEIARLDDQVARLRRQGAKFSVDPVLGEADALRRAVEFLASTQPDSTTRLSEGGDPGRGRKEIARKAFLEAARQYAPGGPVIKAADAHFEQWWRTPIPGEGA